MENEILQQILTELKGVTQRLDKIEVRVDTLQEDLTRTREIGLRMETNHGDMLRAISDGYTCHTDKLNEHTDLLNRMNDKIDDLDTYVSVHDTQIKKLVK